MRRDPFESRIARATRRAAPVNSPYRRNVWALNVRYPTTADKARIWLAMQDVMRGER